MYIYIYIYIYTYAYMLYLYIYTHVYVCVCIYNPHLGLINTSPPYLCFSSKRPFSLFIYYQKGQKYTQITAKTLLIIFPPSWGDPFARIKYGTFI